MKKIDVDISEDLDFNIKTVNKINNNKRVKYVYKCIFFSPITKLDCVNSMDIYDDLLIYGTIMGNVILCHIDKNYLIPKKIVLPNGITDRENEENLKDIYLQKNKEKVFIYSNRNSHNNKTYSNMNDINNENSNEINTANCANKEKNEDEEKEDNGKIEKNIQNLKYDDPSPIPYPQEINLISNSSENIPCIIFDTKDNVIISMGDQELIKIEKISTLNPNSPKINSTYISYCPLNEQFMDINTGKQYDATNIKEYKSKKLEANEIGNLLNHRPILTDIKKKKERNYYSFFDKKILKK